MILITGAAGNVGRELVRQLDKEGQNIRILVHNRLPEGIDGRIESVSGDLTKPETLSDAFKGVEKMFLIMPGRGPSGSRNMTGVLDAAQQAGIPHIVFLSTLGVTLNPMPQIGLWHHEAEQAIEKSGISYTFLRPGAFMSNTLRWANMIKSEAAVSVPGGEGKQAPIDPYDIAAVARVSLTTKGHENKTYLLTGSELLNEKEQVKTLSSVLGKPIRHQDIPLTAHGEKMHAIGIPPFMVDALLELAEMVHSNKVNIMTQSVDQVTGQSPVTFEKWCQKHKEAFK